jgi:hypothetical protein
MALSLDQLDYTRRIETSYIKRIEDILVPAWAWQDTRPGGGRHRLYCHRADPGAVQSEDAGCVASK